MKTITALSTLFVSNLALAHTDHALGHGIGHDIYHIAFTALAIGVVIKGITWLKRGSKKATK